MKYRFKSEVTAWDFWKSSMRHMYNSLAGVCNIVFTFAMIVLAVVFLGKVNWLYSSLIILGCCWFTVLQPIGIYLRHVKSLENLPKDMELGFDEKGLHITTQGKQENIPWKKIVRVSIDKDKVILYSDAKHGYILMNRTLGEDRQVFLQFVKSHCDTKIA